MRKVTVLIISLSVMLSSCASILNSKYQKIAIRKDNSDQILIDGEPAKTKDGKYLFKRDLRPKQITIKSEGYKDANVVIMQYKKSPLHILSWIPFGILFYPPMLDLSDKSWDYDNKEIFFTKTAGIKHKDPDSKEIKVNEVKIKLEKGNIKTRFFPTYKNYIKNKETKAAKIAEGKVSIENTIFSVVLNDLLKSKGYIDTATTVLKDSYIDNLLINATIKDYTIHKVSNLVLEGGSMIYVDLTIDWEILDFYKKTIYSQTTTNRSSEFAISYSKYDEITRNAIEDVMENGLIELMKSDKVNFLLHDKTEIENEKKMSEFIIPKSTSYVSSLSQGVNSAVTIKTKHGFGSGFIISNDGYIITNYHTVSDSTDLKVILNNESEYKAEIIRKTKIYDLALLKIDAKKLTPYNISSSKKVQIASEIYAIGTPSAEDLSQTVSKGIVSGVRNINDSKLIQTDASINSGNSGGPLINKKGEVIGVVSAKLKGFGVEGVAFGIPAYEIFDRLNIVIK